ncbi:hypothetical protein WH50_02370 [Pokkaliibacter plantistimulans]|uniref:Uncharacterized protein n=1 Tax=Pokkaliibacter plantistimulans TaxID=1635171 RepID=A0ABX5M1P9_9GAMM|nr:hypothetical protein [Pokkaliibacter plantistimulans]PXF32814.1 hypothetical protein WH50_02370 [Pokkaliibacter plantistimulans]
MTSLAANRFVTGQRFIDYGGGSSSQSQFNRDQFSNSNGLGQQNQFEMQPLGEMIRQILQDLIKMLMGNNQGQPSNSGSDNSKSTSPVGSSSGSAPHSPQQSDEPRIIKLGSNISAAEKTDLEFGANKTLVDDGKNNQLHNIYLKSSDSASNDLFQNLHFTQDSRSAR